MKVKTPTLCCLLLLMATALALGACAPKKIPPAEAKSEVQFFDAASFDRHLSSSLRADLPEVTVLFPASITMNSIPKRLDHWLSKVEEYGGEVKLVPILDSDKGIFSEMLSLLVSAYDYLKDKAIYSPVQDYNVLIYYMQGNGLITKVVFERKDKETPTQN